MNTRTKRIFFTALTTLGLFAPFAYTSCVKDNSDNTCKSIACANGGSCTKGVCSCPIGYQGTYCETSSRLKFVRQWNVFEKGSVSPSRQYPISIENGTAADAVRIRNFYNYFTGKVAATVHLDSLIIPNQQMEGKVVFGKGTISASGDTIRMRYEIIDTATQMVDDFGYYEELNNSKPSVWSR